MLVKVMLNDQGYIESYCELGFIAENYIEKQLDDKYIDEIKTLRNDEVISINYCLSKSFQENYNCFKAIGEELIFDEKKKLQLEEIKKLNEQKDIQSKIMDLTNQKEFYQSKGWSTADLEKEILILEEKLSDLK